MWYRQDEKGPRGNVKRDPLSHTGDRFPGTSRKRRDTVVWHDSSQEDPEVIRMSQWPEIRQMHVVDDVPKKQIAERLGLDIKTVRRAVAQAPAPGATSGVATPSSGSVACADRAVAAAGSSTDGQAHPPVAAAVGGTGCRAHGVLVCGAAEGRRGAEGSVCAPQPAAWGDAGRACRAGATVLDPLHLLPVLERKHRAVPEATALQDWALAPVWQQVRTALRQQTRKPDQEWVRMLRLLDTYPAPAVEAAVAAALARDSPRLETVRLLLRQRAAGPRPAIRPRPHRPGGSGPDRGLRPDVGRL